MFGIQVRVGVSSFYIWDRVDHFQGKKPISFSLWPTWLGSKKYENHCVCAYIDRVVGILCFDELALIVRPRKGL